MPNKILKQLLEEKKIKYKGGLYRITQIDLAYNTNRIEGSKLTEEQTRSIFETNTITLEHKKDPDIINVNDIIETINHFKLFDYMLENVMAPLSEDLMKTFHKIIKTGTSDAESDWFKVGDYKTLQNIVGDTKTTPPKKVQSEILDLLDKYNSIELVTINNIIDFHVKFENIHPFQDGNGRVGRILMFKECLKNNITPFIIDANYKDFYYRGLREYKNESGYLIDTCLTAQDNYEKKIKGFVY
jgi:Fic family protein